MRMQCSSNFNNLLLLLFKVWYPVIIPMQFCIDNDVLIQINNQNQGKLGMMRSASLHDVGCVI
jgi:hypothetical protein